MPERKLIDSKAALIDAFDDADESVAAGQVVKIRGLHFDGLRMAIGPVPIGPRRFPSGVVFEDCLFTEFDFDDVSGASFVKCVATGVTFGDMLACTIFDSKFRDTSFGRLKGCDWSGTELNRCRFSKLATCRLERCTLVNCFLDDLAAVTTTFSKCKFEGVVLARAKIRASRLEGCYFSDVTEMYDLEFSSGIVHDTSMDRALLSGAAFETTTISYSSFLSAQLSQSAFSDVGWIETTLRGANFVEASFHNTTMYHVDLGLADLSEADISGLTFGEGVNLQGAHLPVAPTRRALGKAERGIARMQAVPDQSIAQYKRKHPVEFESLKTELASVQRITPSIVEALIQKYGFEWNLTTSSYRSNMQRLSPEPNSVLQLNVRLASVAQGDDLKNLKAIKELSVRSGHPVHKAGDLFTIGWVRYSDYPDQKIALVEEVQSDLPIVRKGMKDPDFRQRLEDSGLSAQDIERSLAILQPFVDRFYEDALSILFQEARSQGYEVEMLTYETKKRFGSPRSIYEDLPRSMGFRKRKTSLSLPELPEVWHVVPNRRRHA